MSEQSTDVLIQPGRPVRLVPTAPGFWMTILGVCVGGLAPLFGFLIGSLIGPPEEVVLLEPIYWGLFIGTIVGGLGILVAVVGGRRLWLYSRRGKDEVGVTEQTEDGS